MLNSLSDISSRTLVRGRIHNIVRSATLYCLLILTISPVHAEKIIIDADVGIDDAMAILLALASPELEVLGITTVFGNATIENSTRNALHLVAKVGAKVPVAEGAAIPLQIPAGPPTDFVHGKNGLGDIVIDFDPSLSAIDQSAAEFIIDQSKRYPGELTLVPVGRLTNLALALKLDPTLPSRIKRVVLMGGAFQVAGNVTPVAEANIIGDPHAADIVFTAGWDITAIGLDVTTRLVVSDSDLQQLAARNPIAGQFIRDFSQFYLAFYRSTGVAEGFFVHDPSAILYLLDRELFETVTAPVRVATQGIAMGQTIAGFPPHDRREGSWYQQPATHIALGIHASKAKTVFLQRLAGVEMAH